MVENIDSKKYEHIITTERIKYELREAVSVDEYDDPRDYQDDLEKTVEIVAKDLDNFYYIGPRDLEKQLDGYDETYSGEETKAGDLLWYDGEVFVCSETVEGYLLNEESRTYPDFDTQKAGVLFALVGNVFYEEWRNNDNK